MKRTKISQTHSYRSRVSKCFDTDLERPLNLSDTIYPTTKKIKTPKNNNESVSNEDTRGRCNAHPQETTENTCAHDNASVVKKRKRGRKRRGRSMGRYPFLTQAYRFLEDFDAFLSKSTIAEYRRKLKYFNRIFMQLKKEGKIDSTEPSKFQEKEISEFLKNMRQRGLNVNTHVKSLQILNGLLRYCNNSVIDKMRAKRLLPKRKMNEIQSLSEAEIKHIIRSARELEGWNGTVAVFICSMFPYTGLRSSELIKAHRTDLNERKWELWVRHPKGENKYGVQRTVPIPPPIRKTVLEYLQARQENMDRHGIQECEPLISRITPTGKIRYFSVNHIRKLKRDVAEIAGIEFKLKDFRSSYAQILIDRKVPLQSVSKAMGHQTTKTTELYYARIKDVSMFDDINNLWGEENE